MKDDFWNGIVWLSRLGRSLLNLVVFLTMLVWLVPVIWFSFISDAIHQRANARDIITGKKWLWE